MSVPASLEALHDSCTKLWVPRWIAAFSDDVQGGFYERLNSEGQPIDLPRRLLTQCRLIMVASDFAQAQNDIAIAQKAQDSFALLLQNYRNPKTKGFHFARTPDGGVSDATYDLYGHAFVMLACAALYKAFGDPRALDVAGETLSFIDRHFRQPGAPGLAEALNADLTPLPRMRRQNPHMHLIEACIHVHDVAPQAPFLAMADEMYDIFTRHLFRPEDKTLREYFDDRMNPHPTDGRLVETGHHSEWVWLLQRYQETRQESLPGVQQHRRDLFAFVADKGFDPEYGGIFNAQDSSGQAADTDKRIWPVFETMRAAAIMTGDAAYASAAARVLDRTLDLANLYVKPDGVWSEIRARDLQTVKTDYRPGTTPYHIYFTIQEATQRLRERTRDHTPRFI